MEKLENDYKVHILCPNGHNLYPHGIKPKTFTKKCGYSYKSLELVSKGYNKTKMKECVLRSGYGAKNMQLNDDLPLFTYKLNKKQFKHLNKICKVCTGEIVLK